MEDIYDRRDAPEEARKTVAITLATSVGKRTGRPVVEWARRAIAQRGAFAEHELVQILIASCTTPEEMVEKYDQVMVAVEQYTRECDRFCSGDQAEIAFRRIQLFDVFSPFVVGLVRGGRCAKAVKATAAWFSVEPERRRTSPVLALLAGMEEGVMYAVNGKSVMIPHDSIAANGRLIQAVNHAFDMNIVVRDDHSIPSRPSAGRRGERGRYGDELAEATGAYYEIDLAADQIANTQGLTLFQPNTILAPLIPLVRSRFGVAWPIVTSFSSLILIALFGRHSFGLTAQSLAGLETALLRRFLQMSVWIVRY